jgi:uncharacterized protein YecE (DUF72 family)
MARKPVAVQYTFGPGLQGHFRRRRVTLDAVPPFPQCLSGRHISERPPAHGGASHAACEPRHGSWFTPAADKALKACHVARIAADPPRAPGDSIPGGDTRAAYFRLHGSPKIYYSDYSETALAGLAAKLRERDWCIFDNTAGFYALENALSLERKMASGLDS